MELTKKPPAAAQSRPPPAPFSSAAEREELERALLPSSAAAADEDASSSRQSFVPTAVPITADCFDENDFPAVAVAASVASLPPPPPPTAVAAAASRGRTADIASNTHTEAKAKKSDKAEIDDDVIVRPEPVGYSGTLPTAPPLRTHEASLPSTEQHTTSSLLRVANVKGGILSEEESADVARAERGVGAVQRQTGVGVKVANMKAARKAGRSDEGLTVDEGIHRMTLTAESNVGKGGEAKEDEDVRPYRQKNGKPGYETQEYDVSEYDTSEYDVSEYKSVYD